MHWISTLVEEFTPYREEEEEEVSLSTVYTVYWSDNPDKIHWSWNIVFTEITNLRIQLLLECCFI
jgi:hypothetical protein